MLSFKSKKLKNFIFILISLLFLFLKTGTIYHPISKKVANQVLADEFSELREPICYELEKGTEIHGICRNECRQEEIECVACDNSCSENQNCCCSKAEIYTHNKSEISIGQTTDRIEFLADRIIRQTEQISSLISNQISAVQELTNLAQECGIDYCGPNCCLEEECIGCYCTTETACPVGQDQSPSVCQGYYPSECLENEIRCCTIKKECKSYPCYNINGDTSSCPVLKGRDRACPTGIPEQVNQINGLYSNIALIQQEISISSTEIENELIPNLQEARGKLADCVVRPHELEEMLMGQKEPVLLLSCQEALNAHLLDECYGNTYCQICREDPSRCLEEWNLCETESGERIPCGPCADDYFCCH